MASIVFDLIGRDRGASAAIEKVGKASDQTERKLHRLGKGALGIGTAMKAGVGVAAGAVAAAGLGHALGDIVGEAREAAKVSKLTAAAIKSTGGAAHITANQVSDLATAISNKSAVDDEAIQSSENLLLTFTNVRNEAGKGNAIFNQASQAIVDMTAAMNGGAVTQQGLKASTIQVGKALNDPIKGLTALSKVGVTFTKGQREQITAMVKAGNVAGAQKVILRELGKEFGGAAAAAADPGQRLRVVLGNIAETIGTALLPYLEKAAVWLADRLPGALAAVSGFITDRVIPALQSLRNGFSSGETSASGFNGFLEKLGNAAYVAGSWIKNTAIPAVREFAQTWLPRLREAAQIAGQYIQENVIPAVKDFAHWLRDTAYPAVKQIAGFLVDNFGPVLKELGKLIIERIVPAIRDIAAKLRENAGPALAMVKVLGLLAAASIVLVTILVTRVAVILLKLAGPILGALSVSILTVMGWFRRFQVVALAVVIVVANAFLSMVSNLLNGLQHLLAFAARLPGPLGKPFRDAADAVGKARDQVDKLRASINQTKGKNVAVTVNISARDLGIRTPRTSGPGGGMQADYASGGWIPGPWRGPRADNVPIMANPNEFMIQAPTAMRLQRQAPGFLEALNTGRVDLGGDRANTALAFGRALRFGRGGSIPGVQSWIRGQDPKPYIWGGGGPGGFDCSGLVGAVYGLLTGKGGGSGQRYFNTESIGAAQGFRPGLGTFSVGVTPHRGHMAGNLAGLPFEARSTQAGIIVGRGASSVTSFARKFYLPSMGGTFGGSGITGAQAHRIVAAVAPGIVRSLAQSWGVRMADNGGWLAPGMNAIYNGTGRPEQILPPGRGAGVTVVVNVNGAVGDQRAVISWVRDGVREALRREGRTSAAATI